MTSLEHAPIYFKQQRHNILQGVTAIFITVNIFYIPLTLLFHDSFLRSKSVALHKAWHTCAFQERRLLVIELFM